MTQPDNNPHRLPVLLQNMLEREEERYKQREAAKVYQLSFWADSKRGVPNEFVRSALFPAIPLNKATYVERQTIFSQGGFTITFTGKQLTQADLDVYEGIIHIARGVTEGNKIHFAAHHFLKLIGRHTGKTQHEWLINVLERLTATSVGIIRNDQKVFWGSLLPKGSADLRDGKFTVEINREMIQLFSHGYTVIEWEHRRQLGKKPLAQALHGWICSHTKPYPVTVQYLRDLTGSKTKSLKGFRYNLKEALEAIKGTGAITGWHMDEADKVFVTKPS
jgi:hypothetical protein